MDNPFVEEIRMEINSCFVKKHEHWEKHRRGKNWIAQITGLDKRYGYKRKFLKMVWMGREKVFQLEDFLVGNIYEVASVYYTGGGKEHMNVRATFECTEITDTHVVLQYVPGDEVVKRSAKENKNTPTKTLVNQLLNHVSKNEAIKLIRKA